MYIIHVQYTVQYTSVIFSTLNVHAVLVSLHVHWIHDPIIINLISVNNNYTHTHVLYCMLCRSFIVNYSSLEFVVKPYEAHTCDLYIFDV